MRAPHRDRRAGAVGDEVLVEVRQVALNYGISTMHPKSLTSLLDEDSAAADLADLLYLVESGTLPAEIGWRGLGMGMEPPVYLRPGDVVELGIDGLGVQCQQILPPR
jgi:hypothetical protein